MHKTFSTTHLAGSSRHIIKRGKEKEMMALLEGAFPSNTL
jgi:hypothetical protein